MRVSIINNKKIENLILPNKIEGTYWIKDYDASGNKTNLISIEPEDNKWKLISNKECFIEKNGNNKDFVYLEKNEFYILKNGVMNKTLLLYCTEIESKYLNYDAGKYLDTGILIGNNSECQIKHSLLSEVAAKIKKENENVVITDQDSDCKVYVNNLKINRKTILTNGDTIFIGGLKIIYNINKDIYDQKTYCLSIRNDEKVNTSLPIVELSKPKNNDFKELSEDIEFPLYEEREYFHKKPRFVATIEPLKMHIDHPPGSVPEDKMPALLTYGPMITMSLSSLVIGFTALNNVLTGNTSWVAAAPSLVICLTMLAGVIVWPMLTRAYMKKTRKEDEKKKLEKYTEYIDKKRKAIIDAKLEQKNLLNNKYLSSFDSSEIILRKYTTLWERRIEDIDFLEINLGNGSYQMAIDIAYPEEHFTMDEDKLKDLMNNLYKEPKMLSDVPVTYSLIDNFITGVIGSNTLTTEYIKQIIIQILAFHSYDDLKIIMLIDENSEENFKFLKSIPHIFSQDKSIRFFATNSNEYKEVCYHLDKIYNDRKEKFGNNKIKNEDLDKTYLIITNSFKKIRDFDVINKILGNKEYYGFSMLILDEKVTNLPNQCNSFIKIASDKGELHFMNQASKDAYVFNIDFEKTIKYEECSSILANIPIDTSNTEEGKLPEKLRFLEMYDVGKVEQLNSSSRWEENNPTINLEAPVGVGKNGELITLNLHENAHGPHGLIAGMTGSGKSEFILTFILSMAINYSPEEVQFILIDYKGGGLAGAFENTDLKLPHLVGTITNLDTVDMNRSFTSIESEIKRRQEIFNKTRELTRESTIDIYKYQKMYREKIVNEPISHLFIICDEFAELKVSQPDFMEQLISAARIGRSLGIHLILATQKPSGVVDPQIWSNTRFRVCMKVQDKLDSNEVIKSYDAAFLKNIGRFYFQVGYNEIFILGQAAYAGDDYNPADKVKKTINTSIDFIDNIGSIIKETSTKDNTFIIHEQLGEESTNIVKYLQKTAESKNINIKPLWLPKIPSELKIEDLISKYNYQKKPNTINIVIGEYDIPSSQKQALLTLPLSKGGNTLIYGTVGSGKENFITTLIASSMIHYSPNEINYYILDFGAGTLRMFRNANIVADTITMDEKDKLESLYKILTKEIEDRKTLFYEYNGDYQAYLNHSGNTIPAIIVIINNYEQYEELCEEYNEKLSTLTRDGAKYGIYFILTVSTPDGVRFKLKQNFPMTYCLTQNKLEDYFTILGNTNKIYPSKIFGRGIIKTDKTYEFQTAKISDSKNIINTIKYISEEYNKIFTEGAKRIPVLPNIVNYFDINTSQKQNELIIGLDKHSLEISKINLHKQFITLISSIDISLTTPLVNSISKQLILNQKELIVINAANLELDPIITSNPNYIENEYNQIFTNLYNYVTTNNNEYISNNYDKSIFNNIPKTTVIIIGINDFQTKLTEENQSLFKELFTISKQLGIINFIFVDNVNTLKQYEFETWYKTSVNTNNGIWVGSGAQTQYLIKISNKLQELNEESKEGYCLVIKNANAQYVKIVENYDLTNKEIGDNI